MGKMKIDKRIIGFLLDFEKSGKRLRKTREAVIKGKRGTQSWNMPYRICQKEPTPSV
jgi:hypothetical protein